MTLVATDIIIMLLGIILGGLDIAIVITILKIFQGFREDIKQFQNEDKLLRKEIQDLQIRIQKNEQDIQLLAEYTHPNSDWGVFTQLKSYALEKDNEILKALIEKDKQSKK